MNKKVALETPPDCTHQEIKCTQCGKRYNAPKPVSYSPKPWDSSSLSLPRPVPKPSQTKKPRKTSGD